MNSRLLCVLAGSVLLAGCGSHSASGSHPTAVPVHSAATQTHSTAVPQPTAPQISSSSTAKDPYKAGTADFQAQNYPAAAKAFQTAIKHHDNVAASYAGLGATDLRL